MLQMLQAKVEAEGKTEKELFEKFICYCKTSGGDLDKSIEAAEDKIESTGAEIRADSEKKDQTKADLKEHTDSRDEAKATMDKATAMRKKEASAFAKVESDSNTNLAALAKAIPAIEQGMGGSFLQTNAAETVRNYVMEKATLPDETRTEMLSFLSGEAGYAPASGQIVGILKTMNDEMTKTLNDATAAENDAIQNYEALMAAKGKEVATLQKQIEEEMRRVGELEAKLAGAENDLEDTQESLAEDQKFKQELKDSCDSKAADWEVIKKTRSEELAALAETIKVLNDDDALELFKKTLPGASMSFVQVQVSRSALRARASESVEAARAAAAKGMFGAQPQLDFLSLALKGKKIEFGKVIALVDDLVVNLKKEQVEDDSKKEYCEAEIDKTEDKVKQLQNAMADSETAIEEMKGSIQQLVAEILALESGIIALDKSVAEATSNRKDENADYKHLIESDSTAKELLAFAKNRLNKFYNPKLYKPPPARDLTEEERITVNLGGDVPTQAPTGIAGTNIGTATFVQLLASARRAGKAAPPPPPATFDAYSKKSQEGNGVIAMIDLLVADLDKEMQEAKVDETNAQQNYEKMMSESGEKRAADSKSITDKSAEKGSTQEALETEQNSHKDSTQELMETDKVLGGLHGECDWLLKYFDARREARAGEVDALGAAKAALSGADFSLLQRTVTRSGFLSA